MAKEVKRVLILCSDPADVETMKKNYDFEESDEIHPFFNYNDALEFVIFSGILKKLPELIVVDMSAEDCQPHLFIEKAKKIVSEATILSVVLS